MAECGCSSNAVFTGMDPVYKRALKWVIAINAAMFVVEMVAGIRAGSQALQADALDFLSDSVAYGMALWAIGRSVKTRSIVAIYKAISLLLMGLWVLSSTVYHFFVVGNPVAEVMGVIGFMALAANLTSVVILSKYRDGDANVRSVWLCSRNDAIGNTAVIAASVAVFWTGTAWPDLIVALVMSGLFVWSAKSIFVQAIEEWKAPEADTCNTKNGD